jgi:hypothetical protein
MVPQFYTYFHRRNDTGEVFYVGKGRGARFKSAAGRNQHWRNVVVKHGYSPFILAYWETEAEAFEHEKSLIKGLRSCAPLVNKTDGGEGASNPVPETRAKMSAAKQGRKLASEHRAKIKAWCIGRKFSVETRSKIGAANRGRANPAKGVPRDPVIAAKAARGVHRLFSSVVDGREQSSIAWAEELRVTPRSFHQLVLRGLYTNTKKRAF